MKIFKTVLLISFLALDLVAQVNKSKQAEAEKQKVEDEKKKATEAQLQDELRKKQELDKYYAKLKYPPGFYEGAFLMGFTGGSTIAPSGSFIQHEKNYDEVLQRRIYNKEISQGIIDGPNGNGVFFKPTYIPGVASQFDFEYGWKERFGIGFTLMQNSIDAKRQDVIPGASYFREIAELVPRQRTIYRGNSMSFLATYHPLPRTFFDPYLAARVGIVSFTGEAHSNIVNDRFAFSNQITNGIGGLFGVGAGLNIYLGRYFGIKTEVDYYREYLRADQFSTRTLNSYQFMIGFFVNLSNVQYKLDND
ncbi:MAG: cell envelope integrity protein TolA [Leptospiraceae bacterium]|nr:cell envelope integrity protein TolA [Leptospiraceae bacterium]